MSDLPAAIAEALLRLVPTIVAWYKGLDEEEKKTVEEAYDETSERWAEHKEQLRSRIADKFGEDDE